MKLDPPIDWLSGDLHLGHLKMLKPLSEGGEARPFESLEKMTECFAHNFGAGGLQKRNDVLWLVGDVCFYKPLLAPFMEAIRPYWGKVNLIIGNHDYLYTRKKVHLFDEIYDGHVIERFDRCVHLNHYQMESWCKASHDAIHLHAHAHGKSRPMKNRLDVGVMLHGWRPIELSKAIELASQQITANIARPCPGGNHNLIEIMTRGPASEQEVVRWCKSCGAIVVDLDFDGRTHPGRILNLSHPSNNL